MYSKDLREKVRELYLREQNSKKVAQILALPESSVRYMVSNDYERPKKKLDPKNY